MIPNDLSRLLARSWFFSELTAKEIEGLAALARTRTVRPKQCIVKKGEPAAQIFAVLRGRLKVMTPGIAHDAAFRIIGPGDLIGEISAVDGQARSATVKAIEHCELAVIDHRDFTSFLDAHPVVSRKLLAVLARRVRQLSERVEDRSFLGVHARLAKCLLSIVEQYGQPSRDGLVSDLRLSQQELGELMDATRESVNKLLRSWREQGIVTHEADRIVVHDLEALRALARADTHDRRHERAEPDVSLNLVGALPGRGAGAERGGPHPLG
ncbi:MAG: Crp/Fnr family transcriptional regulator [Polyangiaceae bacterium]|nr:Crp/Fnr family transcriptional regulator [Polyangiaceae bacterium]